MCGDKATVKWLPRFRREYEAVLELPSQPPLPFSLPVILYVTEIAGEIITPLMPRHDARARRGAGVESGAVTGDKGKATVLTELSLILAAIFWGTNYAATKYAAEYLPQLLLVAFRFTVGALLLLLVLRLLEPQSGLERKDVPTMLGLGCLGVATAQTAFTFGISLTSASNTASSSPPRRYGVCSLASRPGWRGPRGGVSWVWVSPSRA